MASVEPAKSAVRITAAWSADERFIVPSATPWRRITAISGLNCS